MGASVPEWKDLEASGIFQAVAIAGHGANVNLTGGSQPERLGFKAVTPNYFEVLGVHAQLGRTFDPRDTTPGYNLEVVLSDGLWRREFGADPRIIGKELLLDNDAYQVVGVMPRGFRDQGSTSEEQNVDLWLGAGYTGLPFVDPRRDLRLNRAVIARLKPNLSVPAAQAHLDALVESLKKQYPAEYPTQDAWTVRLIPLSETVVGSVRQSLILLFGAVALVLLISCVNVANLLLARASMRGREIAVRQALGAQRMRLVRQFLAESLLLFVLGGIAGFAILFLTRKFLLQFIPQSLPHLNDIAINWGVLAFALAVSVLAGTVFGLAPAWLMSRFDLIGTLRQEGRSSSGSRERSRARQILVVSELALSLVLMVAAGLLLRSFWDLYQVQPGFNPDRVMAVETWLPGPNDPSADIYRTATQESVLVREILRRSRTLPGVEEAGVGDADALPLGHSHPGTLPLVREGVETTENQAPAIDSPIVSPEYFHLLGIPLLRGRLFSDEDVEATPRVAVINQAAARAYWPNENAVGKRVRLRLSNREPGSTAPAAWTTIVGVIADARTESLADAAIPLIYRSVYQHPAKDLAIILRGQLDPSAISVQVREQVQSIDPVLPVFHAQTLHEVLDTSLSVRRFSMEMVAFFAATALLLAALGIYGTISYLVNEQRREIAIRLALGAQRASILRMVSATGTRPGRRGRRARLGRCARRLSPDGGVAVRRVAHRSAYVRRRHARAYPRRARRQLHSGAACHAPRSDRVAPLRVTRLSAPRGASLRLRYGTMLAVRCAHTAEVPMAAESNAASTTPANPSRYARFAVRLSAHCKRNNTAPKISTAFHTYSGAVCVRAPMYGQRLIDPDCITKVPSSIIGRCTAGLRR